MGTRGRAHPGASQDRDLAFQRAQQLLDRRGQRRAPRIGGREPDRPGRFGARRPAARAHALRMQRQREVREAVRDRRKLVAQRHVGREARFAPSRARRRRAAIRAGSTVRPRCRRGGRRSKRISPPRSISSTRSARCGSAFRGRGDGNASTRSVVNATQSSATGQAGACGLRARAHRRAEVHQRLRVGLDVARGQQRLGDVPHLRFDTGAAGEACDAAMPRQHALDVAVEDGAARARWRTRRWPPRSSVRCPAASPACPHPRGNAPACSRHDLLRRRVQVMRAPVVAQAAPVLEHALDGRGGERANIGKFGDEPLVVRNDRGHLRLLQHDFGQPDAIGVARVLPREAVAPVRALPLDQACRECGRVSPHR